jgi:hypothetical protein
MGGGDSGETSLACPPPIAKAKPAIRLNDLIPTKKVLSGRRITFGVRTKPISKS